MGQPPSAYLGFKDKDKDRLLELAYTLYEDGLCSCGWPIVICQDPENDGWFELPDRTTICQVRAVLDRESKERRGNSSYEPEPGELLNVVLNRGSLLAADPDPDYQRDEAAERGESAESQQR